MRVYIPATTVELRHLADAGELAASADKPITAFAVTPELRDWYVNDSQDDAEELEYAALTEAARGSLRLIDADPTAAPRRVVIAADVADAGVEVRDDLDRGVVRIAESVPLASIAAVHVDDADAAEAIAEAAASVIAADLGSDDAREHVDDAEGYELSWYANQEIAGILDAL